MKITAIKQQVKREGRYSIFVDEKYSFSLSELALINSGVRIGLEVTPDQLQVFKDTSVRDKAYNQVLGLIARRMRSRWEVEQYLSRKGHDKELREDVLAKLETAGYIDDHKFAQSWVSTRRLLKSTSKRRLGLELKQKRIFDEIIESVLKDDDTDERKVLRELVEKKRRQTRYKDDVKLMQYLSRQGFSYGDIKSAMTEGED